MKKTAVIIFVSMGFYVGLYFLLMARNCSAADKLGNVVFNSSFRLAGSAGRNGPLSIDVSEVTFLNYLFYPIDKAYYALFPPNFPLNRTNLTTIRGE